MHDCNQEGVTVDKECDNSKEGVKGIREVCQLMGRCNGHWGDVRSLAKVWQYLGRCEMYKEGVSVDREV